VEISETDKLGARLYAMEFRLAELDQERHQMQIRVDQLQTQFDDARMAELMGEDANAASAEIGPELERSRGSLEKQQAVIDQVKQIRRKARGEYTMRRWKERQDARRREGTG